MHSTSNSNSQASRSKGNLYTNLLDKLRQDPTHSGISWILYETEGLVLVNIYGNTIQLHTPTCPLDKLSHLSGPWGNSDWSNSIRSLNGGNSKGAPMDNVSLTACTHKNYKKYMKKLLWFELLSTMVIQLIFQIHYILEIMLVEFLCPYSFNSISVDKWQAQYLRLLTEIQPWSHG